MEKKPWYKRKNVWKWIGISYLAIMLVGIVGGFITNEDDSDVVDANSDVEPVIAEVNETAAPSPIIEELTPLSKDEVLAKFAVDSEMESYNDAEFNFVGNRKDTADYYSLADTKEYRNASVVFKDGEIARVKLIPSDDQNVAKLFEEFGITEEPRKLSGVAGAYEVAIIPLYWSQNIEKYPYELD